MGDVCEEQQVREAQGQELEQPEVEEGEGREDVETHVGAARLDGVADKLILLVVEEGEAREEEGGEAEGHREHPPRLTWRRRETLAVTQTHTTTTRSNVFRFLLHKLILSLS